MSDITVPTIDLPPIPVAPVDMTGDLNIQPTPIDDSFTPTMSNVLGGVTMPTVTDAGLNSGNNSSFGSGSQSTSFNDPVTQWQNNQQSYWGDVDQYINSTNTPDAYNNNDVTLNDMSSLNYENGGLSSLEPDTQLSPSQISAPTLSTVNVGTGGDPIENDAVQNLYAQEHDPYNVMNANSGLTLVPPDAYDPTNFAWLSADREVATQIETGMAANGQSANDIQNFENRFSAAAYQALAGNAQSYVDYYAQQTNLAYDDRASSANAYIGTAYAAMTNAGVGFDQNGFNQLVGATNQAMQNDGLVLPGLGGTLITTNPQQAGTLVANMIPSSYLNSSQFISGNPAYTGGMTVGISANDCTSDSNLGVPVGSVTITQSIPQALGQATVIVDQQMLSTNGSGAPGLIPSEMPAPTYPLNSPFENNANEQLENMTQSSETVNSISNQLGLVENVVAVVADTSQLTTLGQVNVYYLPSTQPGQPGTYSFLVSTNQQQENNGWCNIPINQGNQLYQQVNIGINNAEMANGSDH